MFRCLFRLILLAALVILVFIFLGTRFLSQAGSSLLNALNNSAASGLAQFIPANFISQGNQLQVSISGLTPNGKYHITLNNSGCGGGQIIDLGTVNADDSGNITHLFPLQKFDTSQTWYVAVHQGTDPSGTVLACGQLVINGNSVALEVTPLISLSPASTGQVSQPTIGGVTPTSTTTPEKPFPNTGVKPGDNNSYDNFVYPRKY
jgi:hypothetical protein